MVIDGLVSLFANMLTTLNPSYILFWDSTGECIKNRGKSIGIQDISGWYIKRLATWMAFEPWRKMTNVHRALDSGRSSKPRVLLRAKRSVAAKAMSKTKRFMSTKATTR